MYQRLYPGLALRSTLSVIASSGSGHAQWHSLELFELLPGIGLVRRPLADWRSPANGRRSQGGPDQAQTVPGPWSRRCRTKFRILVWHVSSSIREGRRALAGALENRPAQGTKALAHTRQSAGTDRRNPGTAKPRVSPWAHQRIRRSLSATQEN